MSKVFVDGEQVDSFNLTLRSAFDASAHAYGYLQQSRTDEATFTTAFTHEWPLEPAESEVTMYANVIYPWWQTLWMRLRHIEPAAVPQMKLRSVRFDTTEFNNEGAYSVSGKIGGPMEFYVVPDYSWSTWLRRKFRMKVRTI